MSLLTSHITKKGIDQHRASVAALVAANLVPLLGVLFLGWSTFQIVLLYWFENIVLGVINVLKMLACSPDPDQIEFKKLLQDETGEEMADKIAEAQQLLQNNWAMQGAKLFFVPFFTVHYGLFCLVHGTFVFVLLGGDKPLQGAPSFELGDRLTFNLALAAALLAGSHLVSFFVNYLGKGEYRRTMLPILMIQPYGRIVALHVAILVGAFATLALGSPIFILAILIVGKTMLDLNLHLRQHGASDSGATTDAVAPTTHSEGQP